MKVPYALRQAEIAVSTTGAGTSRAILVNPKFNAAILVGECPSVPQMRELIEEFEQDLYASLKRLLKSRKGAVEDNQDDLDLKEQPFYFSGHWVKQDADSLTPRRYVFSVDNTKALRLAAGFSGGGPRSPDYLSFPNEQFLKLGWDEQQSLIDKALGSTLASMQAAIKPSAYDYGVVLPDLKELLVQRGNVQVFLTEVLERATPKNTTGELGCRTTQFLMWGFLAFLHRRGHLLLPISSYYLNLRSTQAAEFFNDLFFTLEQQEVFAQLWQKTTHHKKDTRFRIQGIAQATFLSTNFHSLGDINAEAFGIISDELLNATSSSPSYRKKFKILARKAYFLLAGFWNEKYPERQIIGVKDSRFLNRARDPIAIVPIATGRVRRRADPFWFADVPGNELYPGHPFPGYKLNIAVQAWATILRVAFPNLKIKDTSRYRSAGMHWLAFINDLPDPPNGFEDVVRSQHVHDLISRSPHTFRHRLAELSLSPSVKNDVLSALSQMFGIYLRIHALDTKNPIEFDLDRFLAPQPRGKTPRTPLSPEMLLFLKEFNIRDDFAFSRSLAPISRTTARGPLLRHYRRIIDDEGEMKVTWWPGLAVLLDLMLTIPLRGFQARWLDTGEGDYLSLDLETLEESQNPLPTAQKGRQMGVFMSFAKGLDTSERFLGLRITTNKRAVECDGRYGIPWCPDNLRDTLSTLLAWQRKYNPIREPVRAERDYWATHMRSEEVTALIPRIFPLFRDPSSENGAFPPTYMQVQTYWNLLCAAAEDELHVIRGTKFRLTRDRVRNIGGDNESAKVTERVALFDLHSLRVSGITALIEAGLPPHFVQEIVGHAAIVMTLYYHKQHPGQVNSALSDVFASRELSLERIPEVLKDLDSYEAFLINSRAAMDALGPGMLRSAIGNGTYQILSHGVCPGGDCRTGGEYVHSQKDHQPVPRSGGCALCRYRVTGPMFLAGLVVNANKIMAELHSKGQEIARINDEVRTRHREGKSAMAFESRREILHRELENLWQEWAAEHQYVQDSSHMLVDYLTRCGESETKLPILARQGALEKLAVKSEHRHPFHLNQVLAEASVYVPADRHGDAIAERDAFLNELLANNTLDPFLLRLDKNTKLAAGNMLGKILGDMVPDAELQPLHDGLAPIQGFIGLHESILKLSVQMQTPHMDGRHVELDPMQARALSEAIK